MKSDELSAAPVGTKLFWKEMQHGKVTAKDALGLTIRWEDGSNSAGRIDVDFAAFATTVELVNEEPAPVDG